MMKRFLCILLVTFLLTAVGCAGETPPPSITTTDSTVVTTTTTVQSTTVDTQETTTTTYVCFLPTVTTTTVETTGTTVVPSPTPSFEGTVLELYDDEVLIRVDKVTSGPDISGTVWASKKARAEHHGGNVWVKGMPISVQYTGEIIKTDPPRLKSVIMYCDCPYYLYGTQPIE